jgi:PAS domain S-box-containing protein
VLSQGLARSDDLASGVSVEGLRDVSQHPLVRSFPQGAVIVFDHDLRYLAAGGLGLADVGLSQAMLEGRTIFEILPTDVVEVIESPYRQALAGQLSQIDVPYQGRIFEQRLSPIFDDEGTVVAGFGLSHDVTAVRRSERALHESEEQFRLAFEHAPIGMALIGMKGGYLQVNRALCDITGYSVSEMQSLTTADTTHPDEVAETSESMGRLLRGEAATVRQERRYLPAEGAPVWVSESTTLLHHADGSPSHFIVQVIDISERRKDRAALTVERRKARWATFNDSLTGLPNQTAVLEKLTAAIERSDRVGNDVAVLFCDLDAFKRVNSASGYAAGDAFLIETARRLRGLLRREDTIARVGGDQFVLIVESSRNRTPSAQVTDRGTSPGPSRPLALEVAERVRSVICKPLVLNAGVEHVVTASVGVTLVEKSSSGAQDRPSAQSVVQEAEAAMSRAKANGKNRVEVFESEFRTTLAQRGYIETTLRQALQASMSPSTLTGPEGDQPRLRAAYQPIFDLDSGTPIGFEALARLSDSAGKAIPPDVFIAVAEEAGLIHRVGALMLGLACEQLAAWRRQRGGLERATMAVNVSALQVQGSALGVGVRSALDAHGLDPSDLVLELTESALLKATDSSLSDLNSLREDGVGIAIDDFGTGYGSLLYLANLPVTVVKIDRSFICGLPENRTNLAIVNAVASLASELGLGCVVEGVETEDQRDALPSGVSVQGWLTGRPQLPEVLDLEALVAGLSA